MTIWKPTSFLPERFEASDDGRIHTLDYDVECESGGKQYVKHFKGRVLMPRIDNHTPSSGIHPVVSINLGGGRANAKVRVYRVAYLVADAFYGLPYDKSDHSAVQQWRLRFRDGNPLNTHALNLEWVGSFGQGNQGTYERNRDQWERTPKTDILARLFREDAA